MPYISNTNGRRNEMDKIVTAIKDIYILSSTIINKEKCDNIVSLMIKLDVRATGDLNYLLYAVCKRHVKPGYNNYKKYLTRISPWTHSVGDLNYIIGQFARKTINTKEEQDNFLGELDCCAREIYRRLVSKYEDEKKDDNGDVE